MRVRENIQIALECTAFLWVVYFVGLFLHLNLQSHGIRPRSVPGLQGLVFAPFLHAGINHLFSNSLALAPLLAVSFMYSRQLTWKVIAITSIVGGAFVWMLGSANAVHIGSSGVIFGLIGYLLAIGLVRKELPALLVSLIVLSYYGWALFSLFVVLPGVSWSGHFFGFASGILAAWMTKRDRAR